MLLGFDPLQFVNEIVVISAVTVTLVLAWVNRGRVLQALTGDDRIHGDCLDFVWCFCCQGCGFCTGDWTRCLTRCFCCPKRIRGTNLVKVFGQWFGLTTYAVELKNIVVGDLPFNHHGDFYLVVECQANPPMMSSLAEEKLPKVVHFPEVITLRLRWSPLEEQVRITVRELNILGSHDLCQCRIDAVHILDWCSSPMERMKRFEMKTLDHSLVRETPPWILLEFDFPTETRDLEHFHGNVSTVRTATRDGHYRDTPLERFKRDYVLLDANGHPMDEPPERDLQEIATLRSYASTGFWCCNFWNLALVASYCVVRAYLTSCHTGYKYVTMALMKGVKFPVTVHKLHQIAKACYMEVQEFGNEFGTPCKPNATQIQGLCNYDAEDGRYPEGQERPKAFGIFFRERLNLHNLGLPCVQGVCRAHDRMVHIDLLLIGACIAFAILNCCFHSCMHQTIAERKRTRQHKRVEQARAMQETAYRNSRGHDPRLLR